MNIVALSDLLVVTDFDGTLAPIVTDPTRARPADGAVETLALFSTKVRSLAVLTGRSRESLEKVLPIPLLGGVRVLCNYGTDDPTYRREIDLRPLNEFRNRLSFEVLPSGVKVEEKKFSVALHTRETENPVAALYSTYDSLVPVANRLGLTVHRGRDVLDFSVDATTKSSAVTRLINEVEPLGVMIFGDDHSDIEAFEGIRIPKLTVGVVSHEVDEMEYIADVPLRSPEDVVGFMQEIMTFTHVELNAPQFE